MGKGSDTSNLSSLSIIKQTENGVSSPGGRSAMLQWPYSLPYRDAIKVKSKLEIVKIPYLFLFNFLAHIRT